MPAPSSTEGVNGERQPLLIDVTTTPTGSPLASPRSSNINYVRQRRDSSDSISLFGHPIQNRQYVITKAQDLATSYASATSPPPSPQLHRRSTSVSNPRALQDSSGPNVIDAVALDEEEEEHGPGHSHDHAGHRQRSMSLGHSHARAANEHDAETGGKKHHHGSMNMHALLLHVLGDALGNVGVISSGLIIWLTTWKYRFYSDPVISLVITVIIFSSALPLVKSASFILLQGKNEP